MIDDVKLEKYLPVAEKAMLEDQKNYHSIRDELQEEWQEEIEKLRDVECIFEGMKKEDLISMLGKPTSNKGKYVRWYFSSPRIINPAFIANYEKDRITKLEWVWQ